MSLPKIYETIFKNLIHYLWIKEILNSTLVKGEVVPVWAMYAYRRSRGTVPLILNRGT
jgi:hypothetical protein